MEPNHPYIYIPIHPAFGSTHLRLLLSRAVQGQAQAKPWPGNNQDPKDSFLFVLEDLHLATSGELLGEGKEGTIVIL